MGLLSLRSSASLRWGASTEPRPRLRRAWFSFVRIRKLAFSCVQKKTPLTSFVSGVSLRRGWDYARCARVHPWASLPKHTPLQALRAHGSFTFDPPRASSVRTERKSPTHFVRERGFLDAEGVGFEPTIPVKVCRFSRPVRSTRLRHPSGGCTKAAGGKSTPNRAAFQKKTSSNDVSSGCSRPQGRCFTARLGPKERSTPTGAVLEREEVLQQLRADVCALLRVKLDGVEVALAHG